MPWTKQQQKVIDQRDADILVSAAAGSGKTAVDVYKRQVCENKTAASPVQ